MCSAVSLQTIRLLHRIQYFHFGHRFFPSFSTSPLQSFLTIVDADKIRSEIRFSFLGS